jgi:hypothetical protein
MILFALEMEKEMPDRYYGPVGAFCISNNKGVRARSACSISVPNPEPFWKPGDYDYHIRLRYNHDMELFESFFLQHENDTDSLNESAIQHALG